MNYLWDDQHNLFQRLNHGPFAYSDGAEVEDRLYNIVSSARDCSTFSTQLAGSITDWPSEYHLSRFRHCLLRPLGIPAGSRVLELGCGCGAITRYLGEIGAEVVAVEGSLPRARVAAERCRDLPNVRVFVDDLLQFETDERFDFVFLIGVLEYAAVFSSQENPFAHYLHSVTRFLASGGRVVVAIENKLGLKYFNGCAEDHVGVPFFGIQDLYGPQTARTFGRVDLKAQLSSAGLPNAYFYYPFPDYKLPSVVLSEEALSDPEFNAGDLLARSHARDYAGSPFRSFDEALAFSVLHDNGLLADLSNSFLVVATADPGGKKASVELATAFSVHRAPEFCVQTKFVRCANSIRVLKEPLTSIPPRPVLVHEGLTINHQMEESVYRPGRQLLWRLLKARARSGDLDAVVEALRPWMEFLLQHARVPTAYLEDVSGGSSNLASYKLPGEFLDCTPFNVLDTGDALIPIDLEWQSDREVSMGWVLTRGVLHALLSGIPSANNLQSNAEVTKALAQQYGMSALDEELHGWMEEEERFQRGVCDVPVGLPTVLLTSGGLQRWGREISRLNQVVGERDGQVATLSQTIAARDECISGLNLTLSAREAEIADLDRSLADTRRELGRVREEELAERSQSTADIAQLRRHLSNSQQQLSNSQQQLSNSQQQLSNSQQQLSNSQQKLVMIESSMSWRATGILRSALAPYPGLRRNIKRVLRFVWWTATLQLPQRLRARRRLLNDRKLIASSVLFDARWYLAHYPDVASADWDPALHYALFGASERRNPGPQFDAAWYLERNVDVAESGYNPLLHYLKFGASEQRESKPVSSSASVAYVPPADVSALFAQTLYERASGKKGWNTEYVHRATESVDLNRLQIRALAFYLPQFHPILENDLWWGKNFTEWSNVTRALPQYLGHYQPHLPGDLGFYDLRIPEVMKQQVELAKQYGISAFCFHYYWFAGKRLLERPLEQFLVDQSLNIGFCLCWANENWTRRWDGLDNEVLIAQQYSPEDDQAFLESLFRAFRDPRYIRIHNRPVLLIYRLDLLPDARSTVIRWRELAKANGFANLYLVGVRSFEVADVRQYGIDAAVEFPPHQTRAVDITSSMAIVNRSFSGKIYDYPEIATRFGKCSWQDILTFKTVFPSWDNTPRRGSSGHVFHGSTSLLYARWLKDACEVISQYPSEERFLFINAWNEWAEGAHLEPDARYGYAYLQATANMLRYQYKANQEITDYVAANNSRFGRTSDVAVILHCYHEEVVYEIVERYLKRHSKSVDVFVTLRADVSQTCLDYLCQHLSSVFFLLEENRGRDIRPFLLALRLLKGLGYSLACKIHTKRSPHRQDGSLWRDTLINSLLGSDLAINAVRECFAAKPTLGLIAPPGSLTDLSVEEINKGNRVWLDRLLDAMQRKDLIGSYQTIFPAGSMYWFRTAALAGLDELALTEDGFELEVGQLDGTLAHAIERLVTLYASTGGYRTEEFDVSGADADA